MTDEDAASASTNLQRDDERDSHLGDRSWHESTWELRCGLDVIEHIPPHAMPDEWTFALP
jgi:hypothetical protein